MKKKLFKKPNTLILTNDESEIIKWPENIEWMSGALFLGLDLSLTETGSELIDNQGNIIHEQLICTSNKRKIPKMKPVKYKPVQMEDRIIKIAEEVLKICEEFKPKKIYIEGLSFNSKGQSVLESASLHYYVRIRLKLNGFEYTIIPPKTLKKRITGKGNCAKELMLLKVYKRFGKEFSNNNLCDAYALARCALEDNERL